MKIGGLLKFSMLDYPGKLSCVVFCQGCPLRCHYCHNPDLQRSQNDDEVAGGVTYEELIKFLKNREGYLEAVVFSGGEPLVQRDLADAMKDVKKLGFLVGLHTSGVDEQRFEEVLPYTDWVGFDVKTSFDKYEMVTGVRNSGVSARRSLEQLVKSGVDYEIRTTFDSRYISDVDLENVASILEYCEVKKWTIQECILRKNNEKKRLPLPSKQIIDSISKYLGVEIRR
jgi:pyruvate formate lyase activating enzyme